MGAPYGHVCLRVSLILIISFIEEEMDCDTHFDWAKSFNRRPLIQSRYIINVIGWRLSTLMSFTALQLVTVIASFNVRCNIRLQCER